MHFLSKAFASLKKNLISHTIITVLSLLVAALLFGDANKLARMIIDATFMKVTGNPLSYAIRADKNGVPVLIESTIGEQRNPVTICNSALGYWKNVDTDEQQKKFFINCANWLFENRTLRNDSTSLLEYKYDWAINNMKAPWQSGMAQGLSLQVFVRAHQLTKDEKYLKAAEQQLNSFFVPVAENGVTYKSTDKGWWYEEFADDHGKESFTLNGMMFAVLGIYDYYQYTHSAKAKFLFDQGVEAVRIHLPEYDKDGFSYYDKMGLTSLKYHNIHVDLLQKMYASSGVAIFDTYAKRWGAYRDPNFIARTMKGETKKIHVAVFLVNAFLIMVCLEIFFLLYLVFRKES